MRRLLVWTLACFALSPAVAQARWLHARPHPPIEHAHARGYGVPVVVRGPLGVPGPGDSSYVNPRLHPGRGPQPDPVAYMRALTARWWGTAPCGGSYQVVYSDSYPWPVDVPPNAWATWDGDHGINGYGDPSTYRSCVITLRGSLFGTEALAYNNWATFCDAFLHEAGHLLGYGHSADRTDVMDAYADWTSIPHVCIFNPDGREIGATASDGHRPPGPAGTVDTLTS